MTAASVADDTNAQTYQEAYSEPPGSDAQLVVLGVTIGVVAVIEEAASERQIQLQSRTQYVRHVLRSHRLPQALVQRVSSYLAYKERSSGG